MKHPVEAQQGGDTIRDLLKLVAVSQRRFAGVMGLHESTLSRILKGKLRASRLMLMAAQSAANAIRQERRGAAFGTARTLSRISRVPGTRSRAPGMR
jgi:transcriptional regulator with XRE-family HTH domain